MTYFPYFRGKQYELITIRESAELLGASNFTPIIEPVKSQLNGLNKTIDAVVENDASAIVIANPQIGHFSDESQALMDLIDQKYQEDKPVTVGIIVSEQSALEDIQQLLQLLDGKRLALVHSGFADGRGLWQAIEGVQGLDCSIFLDGKSGRLYQRHFQDMTSRILLRDGFEKRRNADHPAVEFFSDLHVTYDMEGMTGFSDYLMVGDDYQESGGPAYTVAIHLTYIDHDNEDAMYIRHFKSIRQDTPTDPAGKFGEALDSLIEHLNSPQNKFYETSALAEFRELHEKGHYPGLGYVKKLSMKHHIETFAEFFRTGG